MALRPERKEKELLRLWPAPVPHQEVKWCVVKPGVRCPREEVLLFRSSPGALPCGIPCSFLPRPTNIQNIRRRPGPAQVWALVRKEADRLESIGAPQGEGWDRSAMPPLPPQWKEPKGVAVTWAQVRQERS